MKYFILACSLLVSKICSIEVIIQKASETEVNVHLQQDQTKTKFSGPLPPLLK